jgi:hypothetical protein
VVRVWELEPSLLLEHKAQRLPAEAPHEGSKAASARRPLRPP